MGDCIIGGGNQVLIQSMTNTSTQDVEASALQACKIADGGGELVRFTTQGEKEAEALHDIIARIKDLKCNIAVSADVHFNQKVAFVAAEYADKVRVNPGNFADAARTFRKLTYTDEEYAEEIKKIEKAFGPFVELCKKRGVAIRLGVNHGSLSDRIMSRFGDTPEGMVESVMEYIAVCLQHNFKDVVISIKSSRTAVMVNTVKMLVERLDSEGLAFPLHLGVTEAGDAEDGRIKSAVGIGALLCEGIGDTIRVSLSEPPENEIPVAVAIRDYVNKRVNHAHVAEPEKRLHGISRMHSNIILNIGDKIVSYRNDNIDPSNIIEAKASGLPEELLGLPDEKIILLNSCHINPVGEIASWIDRFQLLGKKNPIIIKLDYGNESLDSVRIKAGVDFGALLLNGYGSGINVTASAIGNNELAKLELDILQATGLRIYKTEYIACPSCGRTLFDLPSTLRKVKDATKDLKGLKIGVMGCIVNGPGEMADADYGYVGAGPGRVSVYKGKELVMKNIPADEALPELINLIKNDSRQKI